MIKEHNNDNNHHLYKIYDLHIFTMFSFFFLMYIVEQSEHFDVLLHSIGLAFQSHLSSIGLVTRLGKSFKWRNRWAFSQTRRQHRRDSSQLNDGC